MFNPGPTMCLLSHCCHKTLRLERVNAMTSQHPGTRVEVSTRCFGLTSPPQNKSVWGKYWRVWEPVWPTRKGIRMVSRRALVRFRFSSPFSSKALWFMDIFWLWLICSSTVSERVKWLSSLLNSAGVIQVEIVSNKVQSPTPTPSKRTHTHPRI